VTFAVTASQASRDGFNVAAPQITRVDTEPSFGIIFAG